MSNPSFIDRFPPLLNSMLETVLDARDRTAGYEEEGREKTYSISDLGKEFGMSHRALRFYEEKGLVEPERDRLKRTYLPDDRARVGLIVAFKSTGMALNEIKEIFIAIDLGESKSGVMRIIHEKFQTQIKRLLGSRAEVVEAIEQIRADVAAVRTFLAAHDDPAAAELLVAQFQKPMRKPSSTYLQKTARLMGGRLVLRRG
jgi:DNA-binding transcriptional MerR regulator